MSLVEALLSAGGVILTAFVAWLGINQRRDESKSDDTRDLIDQLQEELTRLRVVVREREDRYNDLYQAQQETRSEVEKLKARFRTWAEGIQRLVAQIKDLGHDPVWVPDDDDELTE